MNTITEAMKGFETLVDEMRGVELKVITESYTLADAIRDGARHTEGQYGGYYNSDMNSACALTAAYLALKARDA
jgi:hypothetical protein